MSDDDILYDTHRNRWRYNRGEKLWVCECRDCIDTPEAAERLPYADLVNEYGPVTSWLPRVYGKHSETKHLDEPAVRVHEVLTTNGHFPQSTRFATGQNRRAA